MDYYQTLGVDQTVTQQQLKKKYRELAKKYHPDTNPDNPEAEATFKKITEAYNVLSDPEKRAQYDNRGFVGYGSEEPDFGEFFAGFGHSPLHIDIAAELSFLDPCSDSEKSISYVKKVVCDVCSGSGAKSFKPGNCSSCKGAGRVKQNFGGIIQAMRVCNACQGKGRHVDISCNKCNGGLVDQQTDIKINIPAGVMPGQILRVAGHGHRAQFGVGDLRVHIQIHPHETFTRKGADVESVVDISYPKLIKGGSLKVDTIWGPETIRLPTRVQPGQKIRLYNKGFPRLGRMLSEEKGNHYVIVGLQMPKTITPEHQDLLDQLEKHY